MRQSFGIRGQIFSKSNTCTERVAVYTAGISVKVKTSYPGRSVNLPVYQTAILNDIRATGSARRRDGLTEVSRRHSRVLDLPEGQNMMRRFRQVGVARQIGA